MIKKVSLSLGTILMTTWFIMGTSNFVKAVTAAYNQTVQIVDASGNVMTGVASGTMATYNQTVRVVDANGNVLNSLGGGGGGSSGSYNVPATFVSVGTAANSITASTTATAPASIVNGNALLLTVETAGVTSPVFSFPAGFTQIGTTVCSTASDKQCDAVACKIASSESGNYTTTWTGGNPSSSFSQVTQIHGISCTTDGSLTSAANDATTITVPALSPTNPNDFIFLLGANAVNGTNVVNLTSSALLTADGATGSSTVGIYSGTFGGGTPPSFTLTASGSADDFVGISLAFTPNATATANSITNGGSANLTSVRTGQLDVSGSAQIAGSLYAIGGVHDFTTAGATHDLIGSGGNGNLTICHSANCTLLSFGDSISNNEMSTVMSPGTAVGYGFWTPDGGSEDVPGMNFDTSGNLKLGCNGCTDSSNQYNDVYLGSKTGKTLHLDINNVDIETVTGSAITAPLTGGAVINGQNGIKNGCSGVITLAAGIGNSVVAVNSNTGTGANLAGTCIKNYTNIGCMIISASNVGKAPATPANTPAVVNCFASPTATATAGMAATATQTAIYAVASTSNSTATVLWWGQY